MSLGHLIRAALSLPPRVALAKAARLAKKALHAQVTGRIMRRRCSYPDPGEAGDRLVPRLAALDQSLIPPAIARLAGCTRRHEFDLLGSGPVVVERGRSYAGFGPWRYESQPGTAPQCWPGNAARAAALRAMIDDPHWRAIDWHVDFRSGYRWSPLVLGPATPYAHKPGVDVKLPWELARMQHLPWLALDFIRGGDAANRREFRHQVLDFLAANPPGWGVNWACAMDVSIRAANILLAWDLFRAAGVPFDEAFEAELAAMALAHGRFVMEHLEWSPKHRGNHYLADIAGLAVIAAALPPGAESDPWRVFAAQELEAEILRQFLPDGGNFEASTAYHRLSTELALFGVAALRRLGADFSPPVFERLGRAIAFARAVTKPSGEIVQIGDNDSGRFFKLSPRLDEQGRERVLDVSHLASGLDAAVLGLTLPELPPATRLDGDEPPDTARTATRLEIALADPTALEGLATLCYPDFGLFIWKNARSFISVRCGPIGGNGLGAHAHNDQLAVEMEIDGVAFARDPGTFVYTPDLAARNRYRSALAHFVPRQGHAEPARLDLGPFRLEDRAGARAVRFGDGEFLGCHQGFGEMVWRRVRLGEGRIIVEDSWGGPRITDATMLERHLVETPEQLAALWGLDLAFSPAYGRTEDA
ncbi:hypothetical protein H261_15005 [Paramagnetospirillum caucaseum]|uniref:Uncharacterized protein n=1 Tax=Paramagnetospirillum caucaseum TaxID=1244869 RepID=M3A9G2_9PROT|nr:heparinase II/III family protein [Paramagnetospirillum caucaseum]EME69124.1 hypothetical protein H261_15005 [Paramagnetospirillum caucaseum]